MTMLVGILAFQGDVAEHEAVLDKLGQRHRQIRTVDDIRDATHLIIPGGESTVMGRFLALWGMDKEIRARVKEGTLAIFGTCAGAILLARKIRGKNNPSPLGLIDVEIDRNAYGTQANSFEAQLAVKGIAGRVSAAFIRAPKIARAGKSVEVLASHDGNPVLVRSGRIFAGTFHPEARGETAIHRLFLAR